MTINSTIRKAGPFIGSGSTSVFPFAFKVFAASDLLVAKLTVSTGAVATLVLNSDYTVALNLDQDSNPGGSITLTAGALASGYNLVITSDIPDLQPVDLTNQGGFYPDVINDALDRATIQIQQLAESVDSTLRVPVTETSNLYLPSQAQRAGKVMSFDVNGDPAVTASTSTQIDAAVSAINTLSTAVPGSSAGVAHNDGGVGAVATTVQAALRQQEVTPELYGAIDVSIDPNFDSGPALKKAWATGRPVNGHGKTYKVIPDTIIDPYATAGVGYGLNKKFFPISGPCHNIGFIGDCSFGNSFVGKWLTFNSVIITGDARISSWYCVYNAVTVSGTTWLGGDLPPTANWYGFYYNTFNSCILNNVICDQRYGPVNLNTFVECRFDTWWVKNTGYVGWTAGSYPYQSFHMNKFIACEWFAGTGITAPDGYQYVAVIGDSLGNGVTSGGSNRVIGAYNESPIRGFYGDSWQIENIHFSGEPGQYMGGGQIAYNIPFMGEPVPQAGEARVAPAIYPMGNIATGGDWSVLNSSGYPYCLLPNTMSGTVVSDSTEPTGLGKAVEFSGGAFSSVRVDSSVISNGDNGTACSYCIIYKPVSGGSPTFEVGSIGTAGGSSIYYGTATVTRLANGWLMAYGMCNGFVRMLASTSWTVRISAVAIGRGAGVVSAFTNQQGQRPLIDLSNGNSLVKDAINAIGYSSGSYNYTSAKTIAGSSTNDFYTIAVGNFTGRALRVAALYKTASSSGGSRVAYRESIFNETGGGSLTEQNLQNVTGLNLSLSFVMSGSTITVRTTTSASVSEDAYVALEVLGPPAVKSLITVL